MRLNANLETRQQTAQELPVGGELEEDPGLMIATQVAMDRTKLDDWPDVRRIKLSMPPGYTFEAVGMSEWVKAICRDRGLDLRDVGELSLDEFCELVEKSGKPPTTANAIPIEFRTRVLTKAQAARFHAGHGVANPTDYIRRQIAAGTLTSPVGGGKSWQFDVRQFPESVRDKLR